MYEFMLTRSKGLPYELTDFNGRSDYGPFIENGAPGFVHTHTHTHTHTVHSLIHTHANYLCTCIATQGSMIMYGVGTV